MTTEVLEKPYLCYVHRENRNIADLMLLLCESDRAVGPALDALLAGERFLRAEVFDRDRRVLVKHGSTYTRRPRMSGATP